MDLFDFCKEKKEIYCYGAGKYGKEVALFLLRAGVDIQGFFVSVESMEQRIWNKGIKKLPDDASELVGKSLLLCAGEKNRPDMEAILCDKGITDYFVITKETYEIVRKKNMNDHCGRPYFKNPRNKIMSLYYHRVVRLTSDPWDMAIPPEEFEKHLCFLKENYNIVRFDDGWDDLDDLSVTLTFDDGYYDFYLYAFPLLEKYGVPATIFISTKNIGKQNEFWWDRLERILWHSKGLPKEIEVGSITVPLHTEEEIKKALSLVRLELKDKYTFDARNESLDELEKRCEGTTERDPIGRTMTEEEILKLSKSEYVSIGAHTITHPALGTLNEKAQLKEIAGSKERLEEITGREIKTFSYPFGNYDNKTPEIVRSLGFVRARTIVSDIVPATEDPMTIQGINAGPLSVKELAAKIAYIWDMRGDL